MFEYEIKHWKNDHLCIGLDEAGRGAFAGPLAVGACVFAPDIQSVYESQTKVVIRDSKKMTETQRKKAYQWIQKYALFTHVELVDSNYINKHGIVSATQFGFFTASKKAIETSTHKPQKLLIDAFLLHETEFFSYDDQEALIKGDSLSFSIAAASILAKVTRDDWMQRLSKHNEYSNYNWAVNKGYGTLDHRNRIRQHGPSTEHRTLYIQNTLKNN